MSISNQYQTTTSVISKLLSIERLQTQIRLLSNQKSIPDNKTRAQNLLTIQYHLNSFTQKTPQPITTEEIENLTKLLDLFTQNPWAEGVEVDDLLIVHQKFFYDYSDQAGFFRKTNQKISLNKIQTYYPPHIEKIRPLIAELLIYINTTKEPFLPIKTAISAYVFEKTQAFSYNNFIMSQLIIEAVFTMYNQTPMYLDEYLFQNLKKYISLIYKNDLNAQSFLEFILTGFIESLSLQLKTIKRSIKPKTLSNLPLRRQEILNIINDHNTVSFDFIQRRFVGVSARLLRYDLKKLKDAGLIQKRGVTKAVTYHKIS